MTAYITGERIYDRYYGLIHDRTDKTDVLHWEIITPENAPQCFENLETLINEIEEAEGRDNSRTGREVIVSFLNNHGVTEAQAFTLEERIKLIRRFVNRVFVSKGMCAIVAIHEGKNEEDPSKDNPHAHILLTTREVNRNGFGGKVREWDDYIKNKLIYQWREMWAEEQNTEFERKGIDIRVSAKSFIMLGIEREPTIHRGKVVIELAKRGENTDRNNDYLLLSAKAQEYKEQKAQKKQQRKQKREKNRERERGR